MPDVSNYYSGSVHWLNNEPSSGYVYTKAGDGSEHHERYDLRDNDARVQMAFSLRRIADQLLAGVDTALLRERYPVVVSGRDWVDVPLF